MKNYLLVLGLVLATGISAQAQYDDGDGSAEFPFQIGEPNQLIYMSEHPEHWNQHFILIADINLALAEPNTFTTALIAPDTDNSTYGYQGTPFTGTFDGNGYIISNLTINTAGAGNIYLGLFGWMDDPCAEIKNLGLESVTIISGDESWYVGGLCGRKRGRIHNCYANVSITGGYNDDYVGGLCGMNAEGIISNSYSNNSITCGNSSDKLGGLCGNNFGDINNCYATGSVTGGDYSYYLGGLCGLNNYGGIINNCYSNTSVTGYNSLGGLCGRNDDGRISNCYSIGSVTGGYNSINLGGLCGSNSGGSISNCYTSSSVTGGNYSRNLGGLCGLTSGSIYYCYSTGSVTYGDNSERLGGLCGYLSDGSICDCYLLDSAGPDNGYGTPLTDSEMKHQNSFFGWDFDSGDGDPADWFMSLLSYPKLGWQQTITYSGQTKIVLTKGNSGSLQIKVYSRKDETLHWTITGHESCSWINSLSPDSGVSIGPNDLTTVTIDIDTTTLISDNYTCELILAADIGNNVMIPIRLHVPLEGNGTRENPFLIENFHCFQVFSDMDFSEVYWSRNVYSRLECDLDLDPNLHDRQIYNNAVIAPDRNNSDFEFQGRTFSGVFDGNGHTISNLTIDTNGAGNSYLGLFGWMDDPNAEIKNLGLESVAITGGDKSCYIGGLCGWNSGSIHNCYTAASVTAGKQSDTVGGLCGMNYEGNIYHSISSGSITCGDGSFCLGGLCGRNSYNSYIRDCHANSLIVGVDGSGGLCGFNYSYSYISNCYATGAVVGRDSLGGLCGINTSGSIFNCYATGSVTGRDDSEYLGGLCGRNFSSNMRKCFATGTVTGGSGSISVGGLCGSNEGSSITNSYATGVVSVGDMSQNIGGLCGYNHNLNIINCYSVSPIAGGTGSENLGGFCGLSTYGGNTINCYFLDTAGPDNDLGTPLDDPNMRIQSSFVGWDFVGESDNGTSSTWIINPSEYPSLYYLDHTFTPYEFAGQGTAQNPYLIFDPNDLGAIYQQPDCYYQLQNDLDLTGITWSFAVISDFYGVLDGNNHVIFNLNITGDRYLGLIGAIKSGASVANLGLENVTITGGNNSDYLGSLCGWKEDGSIYNCYANGSIIGGDGSDYIGGLCGYNEYGNISNCYATGSVSGEDDSAFLGGLCGYNLKGNISNCYAIVLVTGGDDSRFLGGLYGLNNSIIDNCYATGNVIGGINSEYLGGLGGKNWDSSISNCYSTGSIIGGENSKYLGGFCGSGTGISNCYAIGSVTGRQDSQYIGGLCGGGGGISNSYSTVSVTGGEGSQYVGGFCGIGGDISNCYFLDSAGPDNGFGTPLDDPNMKMQSNFVGWDFIEETANGTSDTWNIRLGNYPSLFYFDPNFVPYEFAGQGTAQYPYLICDPNDLGAIWQQPDRHYQLQRDIDFTGINWLIAVIPNFRGVFNGNNHTISNLYISGSSYRGLIGISTSDVLIYNLGLKNVRISGGNDFRYLGCLCGINSGNIRNCFASGSISGGVNSGVLGGLCGLNILGSIDNCYTTCTINVGDLSEFFGGLCGQNTGSISNCYATGLVTGGDDPQFLGGLCGRNFGSISNCYASGSVTGGYSSYSLGGLCGWNDNDGIISNCYFLDTAGPDNGWGTPLSDPNMRIQSNFVNWDFVGEEDNGTENHWQLCFDGYDYPRLGWQFINPADFLYPGRVDHYDLFVFTHDWLTIDSRCCDIAPTNPDGIVNLFDYGEFTKHWLKE